MAPMLSKQRQRSKPRLAEPDPRLEPWQHDASMQTIGVISDTHGLLRPEALAQLRGVHHIVHAGDIGSDAILTALRAIAPVTAVRGNNDRGEWARALPHSATLEIEGRRIHVV